MARENFNAKVEQYGMMWPRLEHPITREIYCIQKGGQWTKSDGTMAGLGLFHHYKAAMGWIWPDMDQHRWFDLILKEWTENIITVVMGSKDSSKTRTMSAIGLMDYYCFPFQTLGLYSSTSDQGLELRVWGDVKHLHLKAKERFDFLPGNPIDSLKAITTDNLKEDQIRDMRRGLICIMGDKIGSFVGIKQARRRLYADECQYCFVAGTLVDTPSGPHPIESIKAGDIVMGAAGGSRVSSTQSRIAESLVMIHAKDGTTITCTPGHQFFTQMGWVKACNLNQSHYMLSVYEAMRIMWPTICEQEKENSFLREQLLKEMVEPATRRPIQAEKEETPPTMRIVRKAAPIKCGSFLQPFLLVKVGTQPAGNSTENVGGDCSWKNKMVERESRIAAGVFQPDDREESNALCRNSSERFEEPQRERSSTKDSWRERNGADESRMATAKNVPGGSVELANQNWPESRQRIPDMLQSGHCLSVNQAHHRSGWKLSQYTGPTGSRSEEGKISSGSWVDSVEVLQPRNYGFPITGADNSHCRVYNLEVERHPSYSVNGLLVHNCKPNFLDALANLNSGEFKGMFAGNPLGDGDPLDKLAEPKEGWGSISEPDKTTVWNTRDIKGRCINLIGTDSPNFDQSQDPEPKYPYMINQKSIDRVIARFTMNSFQYFSQCKGIRMAGMDAMKVITRDMCMEFHALEQVFWKNETRTKALGIDAAYGNIGGDRCVAQPVEWGKDVTEKTILNTELPIIVPVRPHKMAGRSPEDQIALFTRDYCEREHIPAGHVFYDATGRGSLGTSFARLWSADPNPIEFGGSPSERPITSELTILDHKLGRYRLMKANEHFSKMVSELWFVVRYIIESGQMRNLPEEVMMEGCRRIWRMVRGDKVEIETKAEMKERTGESPDLFDALVVACEGARRLGFSIAKMEIQDAKQYNDSWKKDLQNRSRALISRAQLNWKA